MTDEQKNAVDHAQKILRAVKLYDLAAALESRVLADSKPVAVIGRDWQLLWASPVSLKEIVDRHNLKIGTPLFAHPTPDDAKNAARYRHIRKMLDPLFSAEEYDAAIDAAMQAAKETK